MEEYADTLLASRVMGWLRWGVGTNRRYRGEPTRGADVTNPGAMRNPLRVLAGVAVALFGTLFFFQGIGVVKGSFMTHSTFWAVAGPLIAAAGVVFAARGARRTPPPSSR